MSSYTCQQDYLGEKLSTAAAQIERLQGRMQRWIAEPSLERLEDWLCALDAASDNLQLVRARLQNLKENP